MTDLEIIQQILDGRTDQFAELVRRYQSKVIGTCLGVLSNRADADDAAQEVFVKVFKQLSSFHSDSSFSTWLYRIAVNHCLDLRRREIRQKTDSLDAILEATGDSAFSEAAPSTERSSSDADLIRRALEQLPEMDRTAVVLREAQGLSYDEIAEAMDCSLDAVKSRLKRARKKIHEIYRHFSARENV